MTTQRQADFLAAAYASGITSPRELANLMAQVSQESGGLTQVEESFRYSGGLQSVPVRAARESPDGPAAHREAMNGNPEPLAELMYGGRMGNDQPGDGFKYRGRGYIQLTGHDNYEAMGNALALCIAWPWPGRGLGRFLGIEAGRRAMIWSGKLFWGAVAASAATGAGCVAIFACSRSVGSIPVLDLGDKALKFMPFLESFVFFESVIALSLMVRKKSYASIVAWVLCFAIIAIGGGFLAASAALGPSEMGRWSLYVMLDVGSALLFAFAIGWALPKWRDIRRTSTVASNV